MARRLYDKAYVFAETPAGRAVASLVVPTVLTQVISILYNLADTFFVGQPGDPVLVIGFPCACVCLVVDISVYLPRPAFAGAFCFAPILAGAAVGTLADVLAQGAGNDVLFMVSTACLALFAGAATLLMRDAAPVAHALANVTPVITMPGEDARLSPDGIARRYGLTAREQEVLALALRGLTAAQMADDLVVSKSTVKFHITNILKKTGFESREQMIQKLAEDALPPRS